jgi:predicted amidohydrolase YtcJ
MTGTAILTEDVTAIGSIHRGDVADLVIRALDSPRTEQKILSAVDPSLIAKEGKVISSFEL